MWHRVASLHRENAIHSLPFGIHPVNQPTDDLLVFDEPDPTDEAPIATAVWKVLLVDDDHDVHATTRLALGNVHIEGRPLSIQSAC